MVMVLVVVPDDGLLVKSAWRINCRLIWRATQSIVPPGPDGGPEGALGLPTPQREPPRPKGQTFGMLRDTRAPNNSPFRLNPRSVTPLSPPTPQSTVSLFHSVIKVLLSPFPSFNFSILLSRSTLDLPSRPGALFISYP